MKNHLIESKLDTPIKNLVIKHLREWPKDINAQQLLYRLDKFAEEVIETYKIIEISKELNK